MLQWKLRARAQMPKGLGFREPLGCSSKMVQGLGETLGII